MRDQIGFIGLGTMGHHMARNILRAGYSLRVYDIKPDRVEPLAALGATKCGSVKDVATGCQAVITMLPSSVDVEGVALGADGLATAMAVGSTFIDMSTIDPLVSRRVAAALAERGIEMLDAPVSRGEPAAREGTLVIMVGGKREVFNQWRPLLESMGTDIFYCGENGVGAAVKLVNNIIIGAAACAISEAVAFGVKAGASLETILEVVGVSSGNSWLLQNFFTKKAFVGDLAPGFRVDLMQKDLGLALAASARLDVPLFMSALAFQLYGLVKQKGMGETDFTSGILQLVESAARTRVRLRSAGGGA
jgi:3-hydroxyisobutyrate dehydrogenase